MTGGAGDGGPVQVFVDLTRFAATATRAQLRDRVRELEDVGATGVSVSDHIFFTSGGRPRTDGVGHGCDPLTTLAAVAGLSDRLAVQTVVMNSAWVHPGLLLRQFAQLAVLVGGERVTAGLGAGWSAEEFDALGLAMPKFRTRIDRLAEVLAVARSLWTDGTVTYDGDHVVARDLPMSPVPDRPPRLLVGGGSDRLLGLAGRFADLLDLHGDPKHGRVAGATMTQASAGDVARRAHTTVDDLAGRIGLVGGPAHERDGRVGHRSGPEPSGDPLDVCATSSHPILRSRPGPRGRGLRWWVEGGTAPATRCARHIDRQPTPRVRQDEPAGTPRGRAGRFVVLITASAPGAEFDDQAGYVN